jgi:hypothetical protein
MGNANVLPYSKKWLKETATGRFFVVFALIALLEKKKR